MQRLTDRAEAKTHVLDELSETYRDLPLDERLQVKQAFQDINDRLTAEVWALIEMVEEHVKAVQFGNCEFVLGQSSDSDNGAPCKRTGIYREEYEMCLCDRHAKEMQ